MIAAADGTQQPHTEQRVVPITLGSLLVALLLVFMTFVVVRNLPGLLEISLFRRWETGPGERYAVASIAKYAITLLGGVLAFNAIGIGWSNVQWLVAAVGLGLGFGLQEIFANFVSGLILLFERPIRVGDTVTVDNRSGTVSKIRIRATVITTFDRKELVVPNKEFVTKQVINWSLSDPVLRVEIPVGDRLRRGRRRGAREADRGGARARARARGSEAARAVPRLRRDVAEPRAARLQPRRRAHARDPPRSARRDRATRSARRGSSSRRSLRRPRPCPRRRRPTASAEEPAKPWRHRA